MRPRWSCLQYGADSHLSPKHSLKFLASANSKSDHFPGERGYLTRFRNPSRLKV